MIYLFSCYLLDDGRLAGPTVAHNSCYSSSNESNPTTWQMSEKVDRADPDQPHRGLNSLSFFKNVFVMFELRSFILVKIISTA